MVTEVVRRITYGLVHCQAESTSTQIIINLNVLLQWPATAKNFIITKYVLPRITVSYKESVFWARLLWFPKKLITTCSTFCPWVSLGSPLKFGACGQSWLKNRPHFPFHYLGRRAIEARRARTTARMMMTELSSNYWIFKPDTLFWNNIYLNTFYNLHFWLNHVIL